MQIRVLSEGGLGNQLFQASFAHKLAILFPDYKVTFVNDNSRSDRKFSLEGFFSSCTHVTHSKSHLVGGRNRNEIHRTLIRRIPGFSDTNYLGKVITEGGSKFFSEGDLLNFLQSSSQKLIIIRGYFQKFDYHFPVHDCFASAFRKLISTNSNQCRIPNKENVSVHIRRGDFMKFSSHGPLAINYFIKQLIPLQKKVKYLSIHSDDLTVMHELKNLSFDLTESSMSENPWQLISDTISSKYFIGSNSSLSWWAAFASTIFGDPGLPRITFPSEWFRGVKSQTLGIVPVEWNLVEVDWS